MLNLIVEKHCKRGVRVSYYYKKVIIFIVVIAIICAGIGLYKVTASIDQNLSKLKQMKIEDIDLSKISDGIYQGNFELFPVSAEVSVTIKAHQISEIDLIKHNNGKGAAAETITDEVLKAGSLHVDAISGTTFSSKVILKAIENALKFQLG